MKILVFSSLNLDYDYHLDHIARPKETIVADSFVLAAGGKGLNASIAIARTGEHVWLAGVMGSNAELLEDTLKENNVDISLLDRQNIPNGHAIIQIDNSGENSIFIYPGSNACVTAEYVDRVLSHFSEGDFIVMQNEINLQDYIMKKASEKGMVILMNPSPCNEKLNDQPLELVDYFFINEVEGEMLTGKSEPDDILLGMKEKYPRSHVVLTLGSTGAWYYDGKDKVFCPARKVKAIDTVGAGDTYMGYFTYALSKGMTPAECMDIATRASSITVQRPGAAASIPTLEEVNSLK
ncbi:MAG: ribokinase [Erysipelotrichaceae bacterium]|nr:ribokinase [Erysipelotrichaceae bacterium]MBQ1303412.1 ribokinase [Erysipelotrichaceae bacterium]